MNEMELIQRTKRLVEKLGTGSAEQMPFCSGLAGWQINRFYMGSAKRSRMYETLKRHFGRGDKVEHGQYCVQKICDAISVVYGGFRVISREDKKGFYTYAYEVTVIMKNGIAERVILHGNRDEPVFCILKSGENQIQMLKESEICYIESDHNNLIWHCKDGEVSCRGTLKELDPLLPEEFFRLQRSYIVNACHIRGFDERELIMDNGDRLLIPVRTYSETKQRIERLCIKLLMG